MITIKESNLIKQKAIGSFNIDHPLSVYTCQLKHNNDHIINTMMRVKNEKNSAIDNLSGWTSESNIHETQPVVLDLFKDIVKIFTKEICPPRGNANSQELEVDANMWFSTYEPGDYADEHFHSSLPRISFVYYLQTGSGSSPLTFCQKHFLPYNEFKTVKEIDLEVETGMLVMFPPILYHMVKPTPEYRYVIAGNIFDVYGS